MATIKSFEVDRWSEKDEKGRVKHVGMLKMGEVFEMLKEYLLSKNMLPDEYFLIDQDDWHKDQELPEYDYAICIPNFGGSEGIYLDISLVYEDEQRQRQHMRFATGKTLEEGADAFLKMARIAAECSLMLNGHGTIYLKENVDVSLNPQQALYITDLLEKKYVNSMDPNEQAMLSGLLKQLVCVSFESVMVVSRQEDDLFSLWLHDMPDVRLDVLMPRGSFQIGKLEDLMESLPVDDGQHLCLLEEKKQEYTDCISVMPENRIIPCISRKGADFLGQRRRLSMKSNCRPESKRNNEKKTHYVLFSCNEWKEYSSMRILGATNNPETLYVMIGSCIRADDMLYGSDNSKESWKHFQEDYHHSEINLGLLQYGYVEIYEESGVLSRDFAEEFPKAASTWKALGGKAV